MNDEHCQNLREKMNRGIETKQFFEDEQGLIVRLAPIDYANQY